MKGSMLLDGNTPGSYYKCHPKKGTQKKIKEIKLIKPNREPSQLVTYPPSFFLSTFTSSTPPDRFPNKQNIHSFHPLRRSKQMGNFILEALNVRVEGSGDQFLVFAHGFGTDQSAWQRILPYFTRRYTVIRYDLVCAGSVNPDYFDFRRYTTLDAYVDDLLNILDALRVNRCAYVGHSISAMIGMLASIRRPELFTKLILIGASPRFLNDSDYHGGFEQAEIEEVFSAMEANYEAWVNGFAPLAVGADVPEVVREFTRTLFNMRPDISLFVSRTVFHSDLRGILGLVKVPCCIMQTARDMSVPASVATYMKEHLGGRSTVQWLETEGHLPHLSAPSYLARQLDIALSQ